MDNQPDEPEVSASLAAALERRFGADYRIVTDPSSTSALERLDRVTAAKRVRCSWRISGCLR